MDLVCKKSESSKSLKRQGSAKSRRSIRSKESSDKASATVFWHERARDDFCILASFPGRIFEGFQDFTRFRATFERNYRGFGTIDRLSQGSERGLALVQNENF